MPVKKSTKTMTKKPVKKAPVKVVAKKPKVKTVAAEAPVELTAKEEFFCREYVCDAALNGTQSYLRAFPGCTYHTARNESSKLLAKPCIKARVEELKQDRYKRLEITPERVLSELAKLAFYDPRKFFDEDGRLKPLGELDPDQAAVIGGIETFHKITGEGKDELCVTTKIKLPDKNTALEKLGKNLKLFTDKQEVEVTGSLTLQISKEDADL